MSKRDDSPNDEEQEAVVPTDCRALLAMTRPLVIVEDAPLSSQGENIRGSDCRASAKQGDPRSELALRRGEILRPAKSRLSATGDEDPTAGKKAIAKKSGPEAEDEAAGSGSDSPEADSDLQFRIYLGMS